MLNKDYKCRSFLFEQAYHAKHQLSCMLNIKMSVLQARFNHMHNMIGSSKTGLHLLARQIQSPTKNIAECLTLQKAFTGQKATTCTALTVRKGGCRLSPRVTLPK